MVAEYRRSVSYGLYVIYVRELCRIADRVWTLYGMVKHLLRVDIHALMIPIAPLNWSDLVSHNVIQSKFDSPTWKLLPEIKDVHIAALDASAQPIDLLNWQTSSHFRWWPFFFLVLPLIAGAALIYYFRHQFPVRHRKPTDPSVSNAPNITSRN